MVFGDFAYFECNKVSTLGDNCFHCVEAVQGGEAALDFGGAEQSVQMAAETLPQRAYDQSLAGFLLFRF